MTAVLRKRKVLTFEEKLDIVKKLENGERADDMAKHYGIGKSTVHEIMRNRKELFEYCSSSLVNEGMTKRRRVMRRPTHELLEKCMHTWYIQERIKGNSLSGPVITEKAVYFDRLLNCGNSKFKGSSGWLFRFKQRCGIEHLHEELDLHVVMQKDITAVQDKLKSMIREEELTASQIYYACEVRLSWKSLPEKVASVIPSNSLATREKMTFLLCVNGTGTHKLPLLVIANPGSDAGQSDSADLPSRLVSTEDACLDPVILKNWFSNGFIPAVKAESAKLNCSEKAVLILESSPAHPFGADELAAQNDSIRALFLPPNCTNKKLSLCSGLPELFKAHYRLAQIQKVFDNVEVTIKDKSSHLLQYAGGFVLERALQLSVDAWADVQKEEISGLWNVFFKNLSIKASEAHEINEATDISGKMFLSASEKILKIIHKYDWYRSVKLDDVVDWMEKVDSFLLFPVLTDDEIIEKVKKEAESSNADDKTKKRRKPVSAPSNGDAAIHLEKCIRWLRAQPEYCPEDMKVLRKLKSVARGCKRKTPSSPVQEPNETRAKLVSDCKLKTLPSPVEESNDKRVKLASVASQTIHSAQNWMRSVVFVPHQQPGIVGHNLSHPHTQPVPPDTGADVEHETSGQPATIVLCTTTGKCNKIQP